MRKKISWNKWWEQWSNFQEKQKEAEKLADSHDYLLYGGAAGGGKSYFLRKYPIKFLIEHCFHTLGLKGVRCGLFCEDYPSLWDRHINRIPYEFPTWLGEYRAQQHEFVLQPQFGGGVLAFRNLNDPSKYMSSEFALIGVDEITKNDRSTFDLLRMRKRWPGMKHTKFLAGTNPGGIGHDWVKKMWIEKNFNSNETEKEQFAFVTAKATDNKYLDEGYYKTLDALPDKLRKAYRDGNWDIFAGQYFTEWNKEQHVIEPFEIPPQWKRFRAYDHGREAPACCSWYALDYDGRVWKYREFYQSGLNVDQIAAEINRLSRGEEYDFSVADPSIFSKQGFVDRYGGQTIAESFARQGVVFFPASNRRIDGWNLLHQYLFWDAHKKPKLIYFSTCYNSIRTLPSLVHDDHKPEDVNTRGEDHCFTAETLVDTLRGKVKISDLVGKEVYVMTSVGFIKCKNVRKTRKTEVWKVELSNGKNFKATPDHRMLTLNGWKELRELDRDIDLLIQLDICIKSYLQLFRYLMGKGITYVINIFKEMASDFISLFGSFIKEVSQKVFISITKTTTGQITSLKTLNYLPPFNTFPIMLKLPRQYKEAEKTLNLRNRKLLNGINPRQEENGIASTLLNRQKNGNGFQKFVQFVKENIIPLNSLLTSRNTAIKIVKLLPCGIEEVYDLTVPGVENFTINGGIVVHNCGDTDRYMLSSLHERATATPLNEIQRKLAQMKEYVNEEY